MIIAFDVDDTLIIPAIASGLPTDTPNYATIAIFKWFEAQGCTMVIWSGGGIDYAARWAEKLGLKAEIRPKIATYGAELNINKVDIAFDDCEVNLAKVNVQVKRINNKISRKEWNKYDQTNYRVDSFTWQC